MTKEYVVKVVDHVAHNPAPALTVSGLTLFHVGLQDWMYIVTIVFTLAQASYFAWTKVIKPWRDKHGGKRG